MVIYLREPVFRPEIELWYNESQKQLVSQRRKKKCSPVRARIRERTAEKKEKERERFRSRLIKIKPLFFAPKTHFFGAEKKELQKVCFD